MQNLIAIRVFEVKNNKINPQHTYFTLTPCVPRIGEKISIQYWEPEVLDVVWDINNGKIPTADIYVESIDEYKTDSSQFKEV